MPKISSTSVTLNAQDAALNIQVRFLHLSEITEKITKQTPPAISIVQCVLPRQISSIMQYPTPPDEKNIIFFLTLVKHDHRKYFLPIFSVYTASTRFLFPFIFYAICGTANEPFNLNTDQLAKLVKAFDRCAVKMQSVAVKQNGRNSNLLGGKQIFNVVVDKNTFRR